MNKKQSVILVSLLVLLCFTGYLAIKLNNPIFDANANLEETFGETAKENEKDGNSKIGDVKTGDNKSGDVKSGNSSFFVEQKLTRDRSNATAYQTLQTLIDNENAPKDERKKASEEYRLLALNSQREIDLETKLKGKGFDDVICFIEGNKVKVFVKVNKELTNDQVKVIKDEVLTSTEIKDVEITVKK